MKTVNALLLIPALFVTLCAHAADVSNDVRTLKSDVGRIQQRIQTIQSNVQRTTQRTDALQQNVRKLQRQVTSVRKGSQSAKPNTSHTKKGKQAKSEGQSANAAIARLSARLKKLETQVKAIERKLSRTTDGKKVAKEAPTEAAANQVRALAELLVKKGSLSQEEADQILGSEEAEARD